MNIVLLSGGSGKRLWPLSNEVRSKQFLKIFKKEDGTYESMVQRMYRMIKEVDPQASVTVATSASQVSAIRSQLGDGVGISIEPCRRDTFPAIALATAYLHDVSKISEDEAVVVCPVDPLVDSDYFLMLQRLYVEALNGGANLNLMGIKPTYPSEKYGYILPNGKFTEKPDKEKAEKLIAGGALWNGGVFAYKLKYMLDKAEELCGTSDFSVLFENYSSLNKISFDYAVAEHEDSIKVLSFAGRWKDLGTWNTLTEALEEKVIGNALEDDTCDNVHVINELSIPILAIGLKDAVVAASADGIIVADKFQSSFMKPLVDKIEQRPMYEEREWGTYQVLEHDSALNSLTKHLKIKEGHRLSYQKHAQRDEIWTVVDGKGELLLDGSVRTVMRGDVAFIKAGTWHSMKAVSELHFVEVQIGELLDENDIERQAYEW